MEKMGFGERDKDGTDYANVKEKVMEAMKDFFRPEFLNRVDDVVIFDILSMEAIREIVKIQIDLVRGRLSSKEISLELTNEAYEYLAKEGYSPQYGARPLKRVIQNKILNPYQPPIQTIFCHWHSQYISLQLTIPIPFPMSWL